jgi:hypothetical protein
VVGSDLPAASPEIVTRFFDFLPHGQTAIADFLREDASGPDLDLVCCRLKISDRHLYALQYLGDGLLEHKPIEGHHGHHRIIRVDPDSMLDRHFRG